jgi:hypothetical protein
MLQDLDRQAIARALVIALVVLVGGAIVFSIPFFLLVIGTFGGL